MISTPQEIESTAMSIANWIVYNQRPFVLPTDGGQKVYLAVLTDDDMVKLNGSPVSAPIDTEVVSKEEPTE